MKNWNIYLNSSVVCESGADFWNNLSADFSLFRSLLFPTAMFVCLDSTQHPKFHWYFVNKNLLNDQWWPTSHQHTLWWNFQKRSKHHNFCCQPQFLQWTKISTNDDWLNCSYEKIFIQINYVLFKIFQRKVNSISPFC